MLLHPLPAFRLEVFKALGRVNHHINVTCLLCQNVVPYITTFAEEVVCLHFVHAFCAVIDPFAVFARFVLVGNLEVVNGVLEVVELVLGGVPFPFVRETDLVLA
jgi:hypothetical protein